MKTSYVVIFLLFSHVTFGQLQEKFDDGNFNSSPVWLGDTSYYKVNPAGELQSQGPASSAVIHLHTANSRLSNTEWNFYAKLTFNPSTGNYAKVYLSSDQPDLENTLNGYYIRIGGETGTVDGIDLYKQQGTSSTKLIDGISGHAGKSTNTLRIKVTRDMDGNWSLFSDTTGGHNFIQEGKIFDSSFTTSYYSGIVCVHTSTRKDQFFFDDFFIREAPLYAVKAEAISDSIIEVFFNREVDKISAENFQNYFISKIGNPASAQASLNKVSLNLNTPLTSGSYSVIINNIKDTSGQVIGAGSVFFTYKKPLNYGDIIITEIFADPSPIVGLPEYEYIEIFNKSPDTIDLAGFSFSDPGTTSILPSYKILPESYLVLTSNTAKTELEIFGPTIGISPWPSLNNSGDQLTFKDELGRIIFKLNYLLEWYKDENKKEGGWSLEMVNPFEFCAEKYNWKASEDSLGGTPGKQNSVFSNIADELAPELIQIEVIDSAHITLSFNETLDTLIQPSDFTIQENISISNSTFINPETISLTLTSYLKTNTIYHIKLNNINDCKGNKINADALFDFLLPAIADSMDIIINEVLFNPNPNGVDFVEIYNRSNKFIDLKDWSLANFKNDTLSELKKIFTSSYIFKPWEYLCLTINPSILDSQYYTPYQEKIIKTPGMPSYNDDYGTVILLNPNQKTVDRFDYNQSYHFAMIDDKEGISLERISFFAPTNIAHNWHSAAANVGYATPGYENSQHKEEDESDKMINIDPKVFTPDLDSWMDFTSINYKFNEPGYVANISIYDAFGRLIKILARNQLMGMEGFFQWDGTNEIGQTANIGQYIILFEFFNLEGEVSIFKKTAVLARKF